MTTEARKVQTIVLDGSLHIEGDCCTSRMNLCRKCGNPHHIQGAYGCLLEACFTCEPETFTEVEEEAAYSQEEWTR